MSDLVQSLANIAEIYELRLMTEASAEGYSGLKMSFRQVLPYLGREGARMTDLAEKHGVSRQAMGQLINDIEKQGFVARQPDPNDKRALKIVLTKAGVELINTSINNMQAVDETFAQTMNNSEYEKLSRFSARLFSHFQLSDGLSSPIETPIENQTPCSVRLSELNQYFQKQMSLQLASHELKELKPQHQHILQQLEISPARITDLADISGTSKQAVQQMVQQMLKLAWVEKQHDPDDQRAVKISLSSKGKAILLLLKESRHQLEREAKQILGKDWEAFLGLIQTLENGLQSASHSRLELQILQLCREMEGATADQPYKISTNLLNKLANSQLDPVD